MLRSVKGVFFLSLLGVMSIACDKELSQPERTSSDAMTAAKDEPVRVEDKLAEPMIYEIQKDG